MDQRINIYLAPHKALRARFGLVLTEAGNVDTADEAAVESFCGRCRELFALLHMHAEDENRVLLARLDERTPGAGADDRHDHAELEALQAELERLLERIERGDVMPAMDALYTGLGRLMAEHLEHMHEEETVTQPLLWAHFTDEELLAMRTEIQRGLGPDRVIQWSCHMFPAMRPQERAAVLRGFLASAPPAFAERAIAAIKLALGGKSWARTEELIHTTHPINQRP